MTKRILFLLVRKAKRIIYATTVSSGKSDADYRTDLNKYTHSGYKRKKKAYPQHCVRFH